MLNKYAIAAALTLFTCGMHSAEAASSIVSFKVSGDDNSINQETQADNQTGIIIDGNGNVADGNTTGKFNRNLQIELGDDNYAKTSMQGYDLSSAILMQGDNSVAVNVLRGRHIDVANEIFADDVHSKVEATGDRISIRNVVFNSKK